MKNEFELSYKKLKAACNASIFNFDTTEILDPISTGIGQERGIKALEFGLNVDIIQMSLLQFHLLLVKVKNLKTLWINL